LKQPSKSDVTELLGAWRSGDEQALSELTRLVYSELRGLAGGYMRGERSEHTLQPTALVNEAFVRLIDADGNWQSRAHFIAVAATQMRRLLIDHAKGRAAIKRQGDATHFRLTEIQIGEESISIDLLALDEALTKLAEIDQNMCGAIELHYYAGLSQRDIAEVTSRSKTQVQRDLVFARAWLVNELRG